MQLQKTMEEMLEKSGVNDADTEIKGPTQVRNHKLCVRDTEVIG